MKLHQPRPRLIRRGGRKKSRVRGGWRALAVYIAVVMLAGMAVIALGLHLEQRERIERTAPH